MGNTDCMYLPWGWMVSRAALQTTESVVRGSAASLHPPQCPNKGCTAAPAELTEHRRPCEWERVRCKYAGCAAVLPRGQLASHNQQNLAAHLELEREARCLLLLRAVVGACCCCALWLVCPSLTAPSVLQPSALFSLWFDASLPLGQPQSDSA